MSEHTPGPWGWYVRLSASENHNSFSVRDAERHLVADVMPRDEDGVEGGANAKLIAAAPTMLKALEEIVQRNEIQHWFNLDQARAAVAKAKGGA